MIRQTVFFLLLSVHIAMAQPVAITTNLPTNASPIPTAFVHAEDTFRVMQQQMWLNVAFGLAGWEYQTLLAAHRATIIAHQDSLLKIERLDNIRMTRIALLQEAKSNACMDSLGVANANIVASTKLVNKLQPRVRGWRWIASVSIALNAALVAVLASKL